MKGETTRLLLRWGTCLGYSEWRPDQPHEDWSGRLDVTGGEVHNPRQVLYDGLYAPQHRTYLELSEPAWVSPRLEFYRQIYGYNGVEGLLVDVEGDRDTRLHFSSRMLSVDFALGDVPDGDWLRWPAGPKYSTSQLVVSRLADEGVYWNASRAEAASRTDGILRRVLTPEHFAGNFLTRRLHHQIAAWVPPGGTLNVPLDWESSAPAIVTWRFTAVPWVAMSQSSYVEEVEGSNSSWVSLSTSLDGKPLSERRYRAKYFRAAHMTIEHVDDLGSSAGGSDHTLSVANESPKGTYLVLYSVMVQDAGPHWETVKTHLPFKAEWFDGTVPEGDATGDLPSGGAGVIVGYDTNVLAAENGSIDAAIRYLVATRAGNLLLFRTEFDCVSEADWRRWFTACRDNCIYFGINVWLPGTQLPVPEVLSLAAEIGGAYFLGMKKHEMSLPMYSGWEPQVYVFSDTFLDALPQAGDDGRTLDDTEAAYLAYVRAGYADGGEKVPKMLGEAMMAHRYAYKAGVNLILSETMTGNTSILLAEARGAAKAYRHPLWGMHIACHVHCTPEDWRDERMLWLNLHIGYLSGASILEDEEGSLAKIHSTISGATDPLPAARQATIARFYRWASERPRIAPLEVEIGLLYGRHDAITGGMSLNTERPVRVWELFGPAVAEWEYGLPEYGWLLADLFLPGLWICPVLQDPQRLRRWFAGTPYGQVDVVPIEAEVDCLSSYKLLVLPGWNTMTDDEVDRLIRYVEGGGTLVLTLAQCQTSSDRTAVMSSGDLAFPQDQQMQRLCGLVPTGESASVCQAEALGKTWDLAHPDDGELRIGEVQLAPEGARSLLHADGKPLLVERRLGAGRAFTFTSLDYFGHKGLLPLARAWLEGLLADLPLATRMSGGDGEVAFFVYAHDAGRRIFLINTDWTVAGNTKHCRVTVDSGASAEVSVTEGAVAEVLL